MAASIDKNKSLKPPSLLAMLFGLVLLLSFASFSSCKYVSVSLNTKWTETPILSEASEWISKEGNLYFWQFVDRICRHSEQQIYGENDEQHYNFIVEIAAEFLTSFQQNIFKFSLSLRAQSPTIEMYNQVARTVPPPSNCVTFIAVRGETSCDVKDVLKLVKSAGERNKTMILKVDHRYPNADDGAIVVILYGQLGTDSFKSFHNYLKSLADDGKIDYIIRHFIQDDGTQKLRLSGFGIELDIKNQEYKAKDDTKVEGDSQKDASEQQQEESDVQGFLFSKLHKLHPDLTDNLDIFRDHLLQDSDEIAELKVWELQDLSFQAAQRILSIAGDQSLSVMRKLSQNFPTQAKYLIKTVVKDDVRNEIINHQRVFEEQLGLSSGDSVLFFNGMQIDLDVHDPFALLDILHSETKLLEGLHSLGVKEEKIPEFIQLDMKGKDDSYAIDIRSNNIVYINDLEKDRKYASWPRSVQDMLRPMFPGMMRHVAKNIFHLVFLCNPVERESRELLKMAEAFYVHNAPIKIGFVWVVNDADDVDPQEDASVAMYRAFNYIKEHHGAYKGLSFITDIYGHDKDQTPSSDAIKLELQGQYGDYAVAEITKEDSSYDVGRKESAAYFKKLGLGKEPQVLLNGVPLKSQELSPDSFEEAVLTLLMKMTPDIQRAIYNHDIKEQDNILDWLMTQDNVMPRLNPRVFSADADYIDFTRSSSGKNVDSLEQFRMLKFPEMIGAITDSMHYLAKKDDPAMHMVTNWVVGDYDLPSGRTLLYSAIKQMKQSKDVRVGIIHNPSAVSSSADKSNLISRAIQTAIETLPSGLGRNFITKLVKEENVAQLVAGTKTLSDFEVHGMDTEKFDQAMKAKTTDFLFTHSIFCDQVLELQPGQRTIVTNGRNIGALNNDEDFTQEDFSLLGKFAMKKTMNKLQFKIDWLGLDVNKANDMLMKISSLLLGNSQGESRRILPQLSGKTSVIHLEPSQPGPAHELLAILDPISKDAQKMSHILAVLQKVTNVDIRIYMNCKEKLSELPLKSFYRYVLEPELKFRPDKSSSPGPHARFDDLPHKPLLTMKILAPHSWIVESRRSVYDLDNIYLEEIPHGITAEYELEYILLEGHCYDTNTGSPPRGLQFTLGTNRTAPMFDTIVMANLGYFQLKANPGAWLVALRHGKSADIYDIVSQEFTDSPPDSPDVVAVIDSFKSKIIKVKVAKKPDKMMEDVLQAEEKASGIWDSLTSKFVSKEEQEEKDKTLNIFTVASGHLYERFLRIMMLSVLKNTNSKVKFWFIKNYLSPSIKDFIPHMAKEYNFQYEFVQYKWPRWLHQQTEKQRIIWGYKILFLDVLFPLNIKKIIYVDADQIVRADLQELYDLDLDGAPYAYTPFCDSRTDMDGFRFWKHGYWANHLGHRKYHISALYVVDLQKFRRIAAGDRLRGQYQGLSQDPNSLSNLDQDLPNNMIHQVAIKSLPQEWLWCETWCSDEQKVKAKTIDLCNNPQTKEPKLAAAMRIVPEWSDYDKEVKNLWNKIYSKKDFTTKSKHSKVEKDSTKREEL